MSQPMSAIGPKQTWANASHMSAFGGKADMAFCGSPLSRSLLGVKRTWPIGVQMPANDIGTMWSTNKLLNLEHSSCNGAHCVRLPYVHEFMQLFFQPWQCRATACQADLRL